MPLSQMEPAFDPYDPFVTDPHSRQAALTYTCIALSVQRVCHPNMSVVPSAVSPFAHLPVYHGEAGLDVHSVTSPRKADSLGVDRRL